MIKDNIGTHKVIKQSNGIVVKILREPSKEYRDKLQKKDDENKKKRIEKKKKMEQEKVINAKMREMAIEALKKEGKI